VLRVYQEELGTVISQCAYCGSLARLLRIGTYNFCSKMQIEKGDYDGRVLKAMEYDDICKFV
jgi:DNA/RNA-binding protein KIN17